MDLDGKFEVRKIKVGKLKTDESFAKIRVIGKNQNHLNEILETLYRVGATLKSQKSVKLRSAPKHMVMPENFYSTTNNHTQVFHNKRWIQVGNMMMTNALW